MSETENKGMDDGRESIWSVPKRFKSVYFPLFYLLGIIGISWSVWYEVSRIASGQSYQDVANAVVQKIPAVLMGAAFTSLVITEAVMVLAGILEDYYKRRDAKAKAQVEAYVHQIWSDWNRRRLEAEARGEDFDEPPPSFSAQNGASYGTSAD